jgi:putative membrane protein
MMYWYDQGMGAWGYALMTVSTVVFWALLIAGAFALIRYFGRSTGGTDSRGGPARPTAEQLLAERFARGEIDENEYRRALDTLRQQTPQP